MKSEKALTGIYENSASQGYGLWEWMGCVEFSMRAVSETAVELDHIMVKDPGNKDGEKFLSALVQELDIKKLGLKVIVAPDDPADLEFLIGYYKKFGLKQISSDAPEMYRDPQPIEPLSI